MKKMKLSEVLKLAIADPVYPGDKIDLLRDRHKRIQWAAFSCMSFWAMQEIAMEDARHELRLKK